MPIKNLKKVAQRIKKAIKNRERIILYGDSDLDGASATVIVKESIDALGGRISTVYFPDRNKERHGLNEQAVNNLKSKAPALLILLDCGIGNFQEIKLARKLGFEIIIIDHHIVLGKLPSAHIIVDPKQPGDRYPFKELATGGLALKLALELLGEDSVVIKERNFFEVAALATIADMMLREKDNKEIIERGLKNLKNVARPGLKIFFEIYKNLKSVSPGEMAQQIISVLSSGEAKNHINAIYSILIADNRKDVLALVKKLIKQKAQRQSKIKEITLEVEGIANKDSKSPIVIVSKIGWQYSLLGSVASRICSKFKKPVFLVQKDFNKKDDLGAGAVRSTSEVNAVKAMTNCKRMLKTFGGHPAAAGFSIENKNFEKFKIIKLYGEPYSYFLFPNSQKMPRKNFYKIVPSDLGTKLLFCLFDKVLENFIKTLFGVIHDFHIVHNHNLLFST